MENHKRQADSSGRQGPAPALSPKALAAQFVLLLLTAGLWFLPHPAEINDQAWHLFTVFASTILAVITGVFPVLTASVLALAMVILTGVLPPAKAYAGFANSTVLLIVVAFLIARVVLKSGLGNRIGLWIIRMFGKNTLGLVYSIFLADTVIAPAFPSNTARSGVIYPLILSLVESTSGKPVHERGAHTGALLMFSGMASLSLSSALWLTAMAANPLGVEIARTFGVNINFGSWFMAASVPTLLCILLLPPFLVYIINHGITRTPQAPVLAKQALADMGAVTRSEKICAATLVGMVVLWGFSSLLQLDNTAVAFLGMGVLLATQTMGFEDIAGEGDVLGTYIWFAILLALSTQLNDLGFIGFLGQKMANYLSGDAWVIAGLVLLIFYILLHYLFVSQTAHLLALFGVFLSIAIHLGIPAAPFAFLLLFATNFFSTLTPQASSANLLFAASGHLGQKELYRLGALTTIFNLTVYLCAGIPWLWFVYQYWNLM